MKHRLTVKIEKRFKRQLSKRFNPRNVKNDTGGGKYIDIACLLCDECRDILTKSIIPYNIISDCTKCPFDKYRKDYSKNKYVHHGSGCVEWLLKVVGKNWTKTFITLHDFIRWNKEDNKEAIELLKKLREKAKKYIVWVENTK